MFPPDFKELLSAFNGRGVRYLVIGGYAVSLPAQPRATKDLDLLVSNADALFAALAEFGAPLAGLTPAHFTESDMYYRMGSPPLMVDILPAVGGVEFEAAWQRRNTVEIDPASGLCASVISIADLISSKLAAARPQDLADVDALRRSAHSTDL